MGSLNPKVELRSQALNLALMYQRQCSEETLNKLTEDKVVAVAEKFAAFLQKGYNTLPDGESEKGYPSPIFSTREDAQAVLDEMMARYEKQGSVMVEDMKELAGLPGTYQDPWGWDDFNGVVIDPVENGWVLRLPVAKRFE